MSRVSFILFRLPSAYLQGAETAFCNQKLNNDHDYYSNIVRAQ